MIGFAITGTDTGVGKTVIGCALAAAYTERGARVGVMKPVETGVTASATDRDAVLLAKAAASKDDPAMVAPYVFPEPLAPMVAAKRARAEIEIGRLDGAFRAVSRARDVVIVEGAGGLLVPVTRDLAFDALFARWKLGLVVVAANRLGVINHVRLTVAAAQRAGLTVRAIVLNEATDTHSDPSTASNEGAIRELLPDYRVISFPWVPQPGDHPALTNAVERSGLIDAVEGQPLFRT